MAKQPKIPTRFWKCSFCGGEHDVPTGAWLRACRDLTGQSAREFAEAIGSVRSVVAMAENDTRRPIPEHVALCLQVLAERGLSSPPKLAKDAA